MDLKSWKDGQLQSCTMAEFIQSLYRYSGWADDRFKFMSDPSAHLGERLKAAADALSALTNGEQQ